MDNEVWISYNFHILQSAVLWIFPNHLKAQTPFLLHKLYKNQQQGVGGWPVSCSPRTPVLQQDWGGSYTNVCIF